MVGPTILSILVIGAFLPSSVTPNTVSVLFVYRLTTIPEAARMRVDMVKVALLKFMLSCLWRRTTREKVCSFRTEPGGEAVGNEQPVALLNSWHQYSSDALFAAENGHAGIVEILSVAGANPRAQNNAGATPLHLAV